MVEISRPWPGTVTGDCGPYSADQWDDVWGILFGSEDAPYNNKGVIANWTNELVVTTPAANTARVATGAALVHGKFYKNTANVDVNIPTPAGATRIDRIVLRSSWAAQTIRVTRIAGAEGGGAPAMTQTDGVTWDIPLAQVSITTGGVITITDQREYVYDLMQWPKQIDILPSPANDVWDGAGYAKGIRKSAAGVGTIGYYQFLVPQDFKKIVNAVLFVLAAQAMTWDWTFSTQGGSCGETYSLWSDSATADGQALSATVYACIDITAAFDNANIKAGDLVGCRLVTDVLNPSDHIMAYNIRFRYK